jgi:uncharacterized protein YeaO (DUF488 family)
VVGREFFVCAEGRDVVVRFWPHVDGHQGSRIGDLLPWTYATASTISVAARNGTYDKGYYNRHFTRGYVMTTRIRIGNVKLKRAYEAASSDDGRRILIDRLWPRGVKKTDAKIDEWMKDIAPSTSLRKWFGHDPARWAEFQRRYEAEVRQHPEYLERLRSLAREGPLTLVFSAHDEAHNDAVVLRDMILSDRSHEHS